MHLWLITIVFLIATTAQAQMNPGHEVPRDGGGGGNCGYVNPDVPCYGGGLGYTLGCQECTVLNDVVSCDPDGYPRWANCKATLTCQSMPGGGESCYPTCGDRCLDA